MKLPPHALALQNIICTLGMPLYRGCLKPEQFVTGSVVAAKPSRTGNSTDANEVVYHNGNERKERTRT